jgi:hypothetical protein
MTTYSSLKDDGSFNPGALNVRLDIPVYQQAATMGGAHVQIWGIALKEISQATDFNGATVKVYGGMSKGLPLADPSQQGLLVQGTVFQAWGNWINLDMTLDLIITTDGGATNEAPANITLNWQKGQLMSDAIKAALTTAYPKATINIDISKNLALPPQSGKAETGYFNTLEQFADWCGDTSRGIITTDYNGVQMTYLNDIITVFDGTGDAAGPGGTTQKQPKLIRFVDMIGQPTWIGYGTVQVNLVLRGDVSVGDFIKFPPALTTSTEAEKSQQDKDKSSFQDTFLITQMRHVGDFRQADAGSWITTINAIVNPPTSSTPPGDLGDVTVEGG